VNIRVLLAAGAPMAAALVLMDPGILAQGDADAVIERARQRSRQAEDRGLAEPYKGIFTSDGLVDGLFAIRSTGVSTEPVRVAAEAFLAALAPEQRTKTTFTVDDPEWRKWMNQHFYQGQGVGFFEMTPEQREAAFGLMRASLSARGLRVTRDIMRLNHTLGEMNNDNLVEYGEWLYRMTVMGEPSSSEPWGWQVDGHHLIINYFVLGDQVVMTPHFYGSEPVIAESGKYEGVAVMQEEQSLGLRMLHALGGELLDDAIIEVSKTGNNTLGEAFHDNFVLDYAGASVSRFSTEQKDLLLDLVRQFVGNMDDGHAEIKMVEVEAHLDETWFAWIGGTGPDDVFYYRVHSPVILVEFDHQLPVGLRGHYPERVPIQEHVHAVVRTPNGNDYGKDLLRQHYEEHQH